MPLLTLIILLDKQEAFQEKAMSSMKKQVSLSAHFAKSKCTPPCPTPNTASSTRSSEDSGHSRRLIKVKSSSIHVKQLEQALRRIQESGIATNENGMLDLRQLQQVFQRTQESEQVPRREKRSMRIKFRGRTNASNQQSVCAEKSEGGIRMRKVLLRKSVDKNLAVDGDPETPSRIQHKSIHLDRRRRKSSSPSTANKKKEMREFLPCDDEPSRMSDATHPRKPVGDKRDPNRCMQKGKLLIESLKREYPGHTPTSGVARFVGAHDHNSIFFPDTSTLYSTEDVL